DDVIVGPYTIINDNVTIGPGTEIGSHIVIDGNTKIGKSCRIFTGSVIGSPPQDLKYKGEKSFLEIGDNNIIREYCTFNPGTGEGGRTIVGNDNLFMAYCHVAHDCKVGNNCVLANNGTLAGFVTIYDRAVVGGLVAIHQFVRIGAYSIIGGCSKVVQDIPPYSTCDGHPARIYGLNLVGLRRSQIPRDSIKELSRAFDTLFTSGLPIKNAVLELEKLSNPCIEVQHLLEFIKGTKRSVSHSCRASSKIE
ncbi:MAG: acyl-ACP--UDP-N-acetylglucosamine O-acyltransferase, partial [Candidatus Omnitrophica bacterium]|nr:acyl-ACP--UDP-N-acetylglucosamine O-acyltransferase [Candidatus Omnitrophota bacterium]